MTGGYLVGNAQKEFLYRLPSGQLSYGTNHEAGELIQLHLYDGIGLITTNEKILYIASIKTHGRKISICEISTRQFLSANPSLKDRPGNVNFNRSRVNTWELFETLPLSNPPEWLSFYARVVRSRSLQDVFDRISSGQNIDIPFLSYILNIHSTTRIDQAVSHNLPNESFLRGILKLAQGNYLITPLITELLQNETCAKPRSIGVDRDIYGRGVDLRNPWVILNSAIRRNLPKSGKSCIVATARNEGVYLIEWIAYHLELGFEKIFLYSNNNQDGSLHLLRALHNAGYIELIESDVGPGGNAQVKAYTHALLANLKVNNYEWCAFIDVDEFLSLDTVKFINLDDYLTWAGATGAQAIALSWILASNHLHSDRWINESVTTRISRHSPFQSNLIKCIVRPETVAFSGPHYPISTDGCALSVINSDRQRYEYDRLENPADITRASLPTFNNLHLYHYELKSFPELLWKYSRNRGNYSATTEDIQLNDHFMDRIAHFRKCLDDGTTQTIQLSVDSETLFSRKSSILSTPAIAEAHRNVEKITSERYEKLLAYLPLFLESVAGEDRLIRSKNWVLDNFVKAT